ncbi:MAG: hypothetical protein WD359_03395, partial [Dehalococcoidia bacterium]
SLAGAYELLEQSAGESMTRDAAQQAVDTNQDINDESGNAEIIDEDDIEDVIVVKTCFNSDELDSVTVNVRHESQTFFSSIFGLDLAPDIGAHARACMGSPIEGKGLIPIGVQVSGFDSDCFQDHDSDGNTPAPNTPELPLFGEYCRLGYDGNDTTSGEGGFLRMFDDGDTTCSSNSTGGGNTLNDEIEQGGANTTCYVAPPAEISACANGDPDCCETVPVDWAYGETVNFCVWPKTQPLNNPTQNAFSDLIGSEGECDTLFGDGDGIDEWLEVVEPVNGDPTPGPETTFGRRDCTSPRLVNLVIIESFTDNGNGPAPILAFASFFIDACEIEAAFYVDCNPPNGTPLGHASLYGFFMNILNIGTIGAFNGYGQKTIALWE